MALVIVDLLHVQWKVILRIPRFGKRVKGKEREQVATIFRALCH